VGNIRTTTCTIPVVYILLFTYMFQLNVKCIQRGLILDNIIYVCAPFHASIAVTCNQRTITKSKKVQILTDIRSTKISKHYVLFPAYVHISDLHTLTYIFIFCA
jgi:hypothetical protein